MSLGGEITHLDLHSFTHYHDDISNPNYVYLNMKDLYNDLFSYLSSANLSDINIIIGETSTYTCCNIFFQDQFKSQEDQAIDVVRRFIYPLQFGNINAICWAYGLKETTIFEQTSMHAHNALIFDGIYRDETIYPPESCNCNDCDCEGEDNERKLGYYTYKMLSEIVSNSMFLSKDSNYDIYHFQKNLIYEYNNYDSFDILWSDIQCIPPNIYQIDNIQSAVVINLVNMDHTYYDNISSLSIQITAQPKLVLIESE